jgi:hypothetical protein
MGIPRRSSGLVFPLSTIVSFEVARRKEGKGRIWGQADEKKL